MNFTKMINESTIEKDILKAILPEIQICLDKSNYAYLYKKIKVTKNKVTLTLSKNIEMSSLMYHFKYDIERLGLVYKIENEQFVKDDEVTFDMLIDVDESIYFWTTYEDRLESWYQEKLAHVLNILLDAKSISYVIESVLADYILFTFTKKYSKNIEKLGYDFTISRQQSSIVMSFTDEKFVEDVRWAYSRANDSVKNKVIKTIDFDEIEDDYKSKLSFLTLKPELFYNKNKADFALKVRIDYEAFRKYIRLAFKRSDDKTKLQIIKELCKYDKRQQKR